MRASGSRVSIQTRTLQDRQPRALELVPKWHFVVAKRFYYQAVRKSPSKNAGQWTRLKQYLSVQRAFQI